MVFPPVQVGCRLNPPPHVPYQHLIRGSVKRFNEESCLRWYHGDKKRFLIIVQRKLRVYLATMNPYPDTAEFEVTVKEMFKEARANAIASKSEQLRNPSEVLMSFMVC